MKTLKRNTNRILQIALAIFMTVCAFLSLTALLPKASVSADETIDVEAVYNNCTFVEYEDGSSVVGKYLHFKVNEGHSGELGAIGLRMRNYDMIFYIMSLEDDKMGIMIDDYVDGEEYIVEEYPYFYIDPDATGCTSITYLCLYFPDKYESIDFTTAAGPTYNSTGEFTVTEMIPLPTSNGSGAPDSDKIVEEDNGISIVKTIIAISSVVTLIIGVVYIAKAVKKRKK